MNLVGSFLLKSVSAVDSKLQVNASTIGAFASGRVRQRAEVALRHGTWKKLFNFLRIELQLRMGRTHVSGYPYEPS